MYWYKFNSLFLQASVSGSTGKGVVTSTGRLDLLLCMTMDVCAEDRRRSKAWVEPDETSEEFVERSFGRARKWTLQGRGRGLFRSSFVAML